MVKSDRTLGGFMGFKDVSHPMLVKKRAMLEKEGVSFVDDRVSAASVYQFASSPVSASESPSSGASN